MFTPGGQLDLHSVAAYGGKGGGGSSYTPPPPTVLTDPISGRSFTGENASTDLNNWIQQRELGEKNQSDQKLADKKAADDKAEETFKGRRQTAYDNALQEVIHSFKLQGVDPAPYMESDIKPALKAKFDSIQDLDPNPTAAFGTNLGEIVTGNVLSGKRTTATNKLDEIFKPTYAQDALPDTLTDQYKGTILDEQFNPLAEQLSNAQKRGTLGGAGYNAALDRLKQRRSAADANVGTLGSNILAKDRSAINDYVTGVRGDANKLSLAGNFDPNSYLSAAQGKVNTATGSFGGDLRNAVGETKFADLPDLLNAGGAVQGAQDPNALNAAGQPTKATGGGPLSPSFVSEDELAKQKRGLGSTGAF